MTTSSSVTVSTSSSIVVPRARAMGSSASKEMRRCPVSSRLRVEGLRWQRLARASSDHPRARRSPRMRCRRAAYPRWASPLEEAGFADVTEQTMALEVSSPTALIRRFAAAYLTRIAPAVTGRLSAADQAALDELLAANGPHALAARSDLTVRATRTLWIARRP